MPTTLIASEARPDLYRLIHWADEPHQPVTIVGKRNDAVLSAMQGRALEYSQARQ